MDTQRFYFNKNRPFNSEELNELTKYDTLYLGDSFNEPIDDLPINIKQITFITDKDSDNWSTFNYPIDNLPPYLESFELMSCEFKHPINYLPSSLKYLKLYIANPFYQENLFDNLPSNLEHLCLLSNINKYSSDDINENNLFNLNNLPKNLKILEIMPNTYKPIENLPDGLETLIIHNKSFLEYPEQTIINLPKNLNLLILNLSCGVDYIEIIKKMFNNKLTCKCLMIPLSSRIRVEHIENINNIRLLFPKIKILCNYN